MMNKESQLAQVRDFVRSRTGQRLPGERALTETFGISRARLRNILETLESEQLVQRQHGSGTYALGVENRELKRIVLFMDATLKLGEDPFFSLLVESLQAQIQLDGAQCFLQRVHKTEVVAFPCDGIIAIGLMSQHACRSQSLSSIPTIGLYAPMDARPSRHLSLLELDEENAGAEAASRLLNSGVKRISFLGRHDIPSVGERLTGIRRVLASTDASLEVIECGMNYTAGFRAGLEWEISTEENAGIIAANDWMAVGLHTGLQTRDAEMRRRLKMVSFDGLSIVRLPEMGISSLAIPIKNMVRDAVAELHRLYQPGAVGRAIRYSLEWSDESNATGAVQRKSWL